MAQIKHLPQPESVTKNSARVVSTANLKGRNHQGSLLIESLLSIVILSISLTFIMQSLLSNLRILTRNNSIAQAMMEVEDKMDFLFLKSLNHDPVDGLKKITSDQFQYSFTETPFDTKDQTNELKKIKCDISWKNTKFSNSFSIETLLLDLDPKKN